MESNPNFATALLERSIAQHEQRLANAKASNNTRLASRVERNLDRLLEQQKKMNGVPVKKPSGGKSPELPAKVIQPNLKDEGTVVDPHGERWMELVGYVEQLNEQFPNEYLTDRCGFFSTEREFARYIREIERRIADRK